jgi:hypothetical protein
MASANPTAAAGWFQRRNHNHHELEHLTPKFDAMCSAVITYPESPLCMHKPSGY